MKFFFTFIATSFFKKLSKTIYGKGFFLLKFFKDLINFFWFIKEFISRDKFIDSLFHNIEKSYFFSAESWALAETFFGSEEELMMAAQNWSSDCQKIFQQEVKNISENCRDNSIFFWRVEAKIRKDINELLLKKFTSRESG